MPTRFRVLVHRSGGISWLQLQILQRLRQSRVSPINCSKPTRFNLPYIHIDTIYQREKCVHTPDLAALSKAHRPPTHRRSLITKSYRSSIKKAIVRSISLPLAPSIFQGSRACAETRRGFMVTLIPRWKCASLLVSSSCESRPSYSMVTWSTLVEA